MISTVLRTLAVGRREWIPSCLASLQISLETDENGGTSHGYFVTGLGFLYDTAEEWLDQAASAPEELGEAVQDRRDGQSVVHESGHGVQERGSGFGENCDSQAWL